MFEMIPDAGSGLFCSEATQDSCDLVIIPVPVDATASYGQGAARGPEAIRIASHQLDFYEKEFDRDLIEPIYMAPIKTSWIELNEAMTTKVHTYRQCPEDSLRNQINALSASLHDDLEELSLELLRSGKKIGILGGDHSSPLGFLKAIDQVHSDFGVLHIDAHHDLRVSYEGFTDSHASIMHRALSRCPHLNQLVSVGIRDYCREEFIDARDDLRITTFYDDDLKHRLFSGSTWSELVHEIIHSLPDKVYISMDIDGLDPSCCPHTGTPVPGGLSFQEWSFLMKMLRKSNKEIIGFDLCEVSPDLTNPGNPWDANVGARVLHRLCSLMLHE